MCVGGTRRRDLLCTSERFSFFLFKSKPTWLSYVWLFESVSTLCFFHFSYIYGFCVCQILCLSVCACACPLFVMLTSKGFVTLGLWRRKNRSFFEFLKKRNNFFFAFLLFSNVLWGSELELGNLQMHSELRSSKFSFLNQCISFSKTFWFLLFLKLCQLCKKLNVFGVLEKKTKHNYSSSIFFIFQKLNKRRIIQRYWEVLK